MRGRDVVRVLSVVAIAAAAWWPGSPAGAATSAYFVYPQGEGNVDYTESVPRPGVFGVVGDFVGDDTQAGDAEDILWYTPGAGGDALWRMHGDRNFSQSVVSVSGTFQPLVLQDVDGKDDILWYAPGTAPDSLWDFNADGSITKTSLAINGTYIPLAANFVGEEGTDVLFYAPGSAPDSVWARTSATGFTPYPLSINGTYTPVVNQVAGIGSPSFDVAADVLWYAPGSTPDSLWDFNADGTVTKLPLAINGTYSVVAGHFTAADGYGDLLFYGKGAAPDTLWDFNGGTTRTNIALSVSGDYRPFACYSANDDDGHTNVVWFGSGNKPDSLWEFDDAGSHASTPLSLTGNTLPVFGTFNNSLDPERDGIVVDNP